MHLKLVGQLRQQHNPRSPNPAQAGFFDLLPAQFPLKAAFFTPILRSPDAPLWRLYARFTYPFSVNDTNGVDMDLHRLSTLIISTESL